MDTEREVSLCRLELKYCERCGALWLRPAGGQESYCSVCVVQMDDSPRPKERKKKRRAAHRKTARGRNLQGVASDWAGEEVVAQIALGCDGEVRV